MSRHTGRNAFTLIEVLIVVIIMAVLAATIIPQFSSSTNDAKDSSLKFNLHTLRSQIEMYKVHHMGKVPEMPEAKFVEQMTKKTKADGSVGTDASYIYGPYLQGQIPSNPFNSLSTLVATTATTEAEAKAAVTGNAGWLYNATTGDFFPDYAGYYK